MTAQSTKSQIPEDQKPFIEKPDTFELRDGQTCWYNMERICGPDCKAFNPEADPPQGPHQCLFLVYAGQGASGIIGVAALLQKIVKGQAQQTVPIPPPPPKAT